MIDPALSALLDRATRCLDHMSPLDRALHRREQDISIVYGNLGASTNHRQPVEDVARAYDERAGILHGDIRYLADPDYARDVERWRELDGWGCPCMGCTQRRANCAVADLLRLT